jgi:hypothetical protein
MYLRARERTKTKLILEKDYYVTMGMTFERGSLLAACLSRGSFPPTSLAEVGGFSPA